ncbi:uncharacterized protein LOC135102859 [Scylla paramamosain]|uniref:uncharacterized protein LOC135102859 n=1 Tax=Scylla paramamosain TaxID=85552 RepID=UPI0030839F97
MWSDNAHNEGFHHAHPFPHAPALDKLCLHSRLGCVLAGGLRSSSKAKGESGPSFLAQLQDAPSAPTATEISAEAAVFVAVIVVFYAAIIVILLGTNMRRPRSPPPGSAGPAHAPARATDTRWCWTRRAAAWRPSTPRRRRSERWTEVACWRKACNLKASLGTSSPALCSSC